MDLTFRPQRGRRRAGRSHISSPMPLCPGARSPGESSPPVYPSQWEMLQLQATPGGHTRDSATPCLCSGSFLSRALSLGKPRIHTGSASPLFPPLWVTLTTHTTVEPQNSDACPPKPSDAFSGWGREWEALFLAGEASDWPLVCTPILTLHG